MHISITCINTYISIKILKLCCGSSQQCGEVSIERKKKKKTITLHVSKTCHETCIAGPGFSKGG